MASGLIIPGVQVTVVKEVLPQQLAPSGVLGLIGFTEENPGKVVRASNWSRFVGVLGRASAYSLPEAKQALDNGVSELVISPLPASAGATAKVVIPADATKGAAEPPKDAAKDAPKGKDAKAGAGITLVARAPGPWANGIGVKIEYRNNLDQSISFDLQVLGESNGKEVVLEVHRSLTLESLTAALKAGSAYVKVDESKALGWPTADVYTLAGGKDATADDYAAALRRLQDEPDVDMVLAAIQDFSDRAKVTRIYGDVISHCNNLSDDCKGRLGFGQVPDAGTMEEFVQLASNLVSDRFVLVAPNGVAGAVAGLVGNLPYFYSPTFKRISGAGELPPIPVDDQKTLLKGNVVPVVLERGRGTIVLRGLTTDGDQINVRRVADRAVRTLKMIGNLFIGQLNTADGRSALKQKLTEAMLQMEKDGAIVPSTDGKDPAFKVEVYSSQEDFALGIVRVNLAVRPVRAIDYVYATITVQV
ncbi:phage tail sheath C-terminal domain-containing protein [Archangium lipolyticum]|uniref:phage tail sheath C-terminal domain-containing protein n=1 Tax=Archangium lipolyticum TaxID=2970465 RepID=UPI002149D0C0|nr:phage tail sheath C-terminal domain-containing protein [Archangium lipolyticum]